MSSQTFRLPSPSGWELTIWKSGSASGSFGSQLNVFVPTDAWLAPRFTSTTIKKPWGTTR